MDAEWGGVGPPEVTMTAGELGVDELQLEVLELESCKNTEVKLKKYSGDLNTKLVGYSNSPKQFVCPMVCYSSHILNRKLIFHYSVTS